jgi:hypothetical protein
MSNNATTNIDSEVFWLEALLENNDNRHLTNTEYLNLFRNSDGDIINLSPAFLLMTDAQKEQLTGDDWSRIQELEEELEEELLHLAAEFL